MLSFLPLFHSYGLHFSCLRFVRDPEPFALTNKPGPTLEEHLCGVQRKLSSRDGISSSRST